MIGLLVIRVSEKFGGRLTARHVWLLHRPESRNRLSESTMQQIQSASASFVRLKRRTAR